ncbi:sigma-70 family RNA polymerase sigma factor [Stieleria varia]|uniref:ECF RNA polymerase sigma-E factor n=1 Tax=Stieleria varia TaxID=2528005 RepID=A0A5C6AT20_9BACT|nr:sigma-70 family RNA polymerase sigma factor [Stieleria varia]TWU02561.1 ECF RNA polymerase sigma-E factor [Stieleria varia]
MSHDGLNDSLILRLGCGDEHAFVELFTQNRSRLKRMIEFRLDRRLRGREDASDILQEVYIDAHQRIRHYLKRPDLSFYIWLRQLTAQRLIDVHRRHVATDMRSVNHEVALNRFDPTATSASIAFQLAARLASPSQLAMKAELHDQIQLAIEAMDPLDREILALRHFEELRNNEVAEVLDLKPAAASNRYVRALARLGEILDSIPGLADED